MLRLINESDLEAIKARIGRKPLTAPERDVLRDALKLLKRHPKVAWVRRMNVGRARGINFGFVGLSDILGQMKDGRLLAVETKRPNGRAPTLPQTTFIAMVKANHGVAGVVHSIDELMELLESHQKVNG